MMPGRERLAPLSQAAAAAAIGALLLAVATCGGDEETQSGSPTVATTTAGGTRTATPGASVTPGQCIPYRRTVQRIAGAGGVRGRAAHHPGAPQDCARGHAHDVRPVHGRI